MKAVVIGGSSWDTLIKVNKINELKNDMMLFAETINETVGGTGAGKALCLDSIGVDTTLISEFGFDEMSHKIRKYFESTAINVIELNVDKSVAHTNIMHSGGKRISIITSQANTESRMYYNANKLIMNTDVVFLNINNFCRQYIPIIKKYKKLCVVDIHDYDSGNQYHQDFIDAADILTASDINIKDPENFLKRQIAQGKKLVVLTKGKDGLIALDHENIRYDLKGYNNVKYVDSNGAGDSFCAGTITHYCLTKNIGESLKIGTICGALACTSINLFNSKYSYEDILNIKKSVDF